MHGSLKTPTRLDPFGMECEWNDRRILATCSVGNGRMPVKFLENKKDAFSQIPVGADLQKTEALRMKITDEAFADAKHSAVSPDSDLSPNSAMKVKILQYYRYQDYQQPQFLKSCHTMSLWHNKSQRCVCFYWFSHIPTSWLWAVSLGPQAMLDPWLSCLSGIAFGFLPKALRYLAQAKGWIVLEVYFGSNAKHT